MPEPSTPLMRQYLQAKKRFPDALLLFRLGDFYELFYNDAVTASRLLQITLTSRNKEKGQPIPMCGVPYHAADSYIAKLVQAGHRVAICEQMEEPRPGIKLVRREVIRVITPGTATDTKSLSQRENNFLAALARNARDAAAGLAYVDFSTGEFRATEFSGHDAEARVRDELLVLRPREILLARGADFPVEAGEGLSRAARTVLDDWVFDPAIASRLLCGQFRVAHLAGFGLEAHPLATAAAGAILHYLRETTVVEERGAATASFLSTLRPAGAGLEHLDTIRYYEEQDALLLDSVTVRNLELTDPLPGEDSSSTLLGNLDETATAMGARLLRSWILRPSMDLAEIAGRLEAVAALKSQTLLREEIHQGLRGMLDIERLTSRVTLGVASPRDLLGLRQTLEHIPRLRAVLCSAEFTLVARLQALAESLDEIPGLRDCIASAIAEDPPATLADGGYIRPGHNAELDELRNLSRSAKQFIASMEERERQRTKIASLKIRFNQVFGYYIEISKPNLPLVPPDYERKQTLSNAERFTAPELKEYESKVLDAEERIGGIERRLYRELCETIALQSVRLRRTAGAIAKLDVLVNFAQLAAERSYCRPVFADDAPESDRRGDFLIVAGRHPVMECLLAGNGERFVPNDVCFQDPESILQLITGPNMGGKSTYLRQVALIVIMAQMGSFVPATEAHLPVVDRIFTRIGASDNLARGRSTFLVEMSEVAAILNTATPASLVLLDEVGRGTATFDGLSIAWAVVESLCANAKPRTLFATHYHELTELEMLLPGVRNLHVSVREQGQEVVFLRRVEPGAADRSYGIEVARLAGLPKDVTDRAREILQLHEKTERKLSEELTPGALPSPEQQVLFAPVEGKVLDDLREADLDALRPLDALNLLATLKKQLLK